MKKRNIFIILIIVTAVVLVTTELRHYLFKNKYRNTFPAVNQDIITAPPQLALPSPRSSTPPVVTAFSFGSMVNTYEDKKFGFSFQYPDELTTEIQPKGCEIGLKQKAWVIGFLIFLNNPSCESPFANSYARSLEDYMHDYAIKKEGGEVRVHILKTSDIVTSAGVKGVRQEYNISWFDLKTNVQESVRPDAFTVRYIFYSSTKGFYFLTTAYSDQLSHEVLASFAELEKKIVNTVKFN